MSVLKKIVIGLVIIVVVAVAGVLGFEAWLVSSRLDPILEEGAAEIDRAWPKVQEDLEVLGKHAFFTQPRTGGDAGPTLNKLLPWEGEGLDREKGPLQDRFKAIPEEVRELTRGELKTDLTEAQAEALKAVDFSWMVDLAPYGYWSLAGDSPLGKQSPVRVASAPMPNFLVLMSWSKLRLLRGVADEDLATAVKEVQHIAWLSISTEQLVGAMVGVSIANQTLIAAGPESGFTTEEIDRMKRLLFASPAFTNWAAPTEARARFKKAAGEHLPVALCLGWSEGSMSYLVKPFLEDRFPEYYAELDAIEPGGACRYDLVMPVRAQSKEDPWSILVAEDSAGELSGKEAWVRLPLIRSLVGVILASVASPNFLSRYRD
jgi:hypothetical protein